MHPYFNDTGSRAYNRRPSPDIAEFCIGLAGRGEPGRFHDAIDDWHATEALSLGADLRVVSDSFDDAGNFVPLGGHEVATLRASWDATERVTLFGRIENVWDETYQTAAGYATPGRGAYIGARVKY